MGNRKLMTFADEQRSPQQATLGVDRESQIFPSAQRFLRGDGP